MFHVVFRSISGPFARESNHLMQHLHNKKRKTNQTTEYSREDQGASSLNDHFLKINLVPRVFVPYCASVTERAILRSFNYVIYRIVIFSANNSVHLEHLAQMPRVVSDYCLCVMFLVKGLCPHCVSLNSKKSILFLHPPSLKAQP